MADGLARVSDEIMEGEMRIRQEKARCHISSVVTRSHSPLYPVLFVIL